jgi:hypothetical protein
MMGDIDCAKRRNEDALRDRDAEFARLKLDKEDQIRTLRAMEAEVVGKRREVDEMLNASEQAKKRFA